MAARKTVRRTTRPAVRPGRLAKTWDDTRALLGRGRARLEQRARALIQTSGVDTEKAAESLGALRQRLGLERKKAIKRVEGRLGALRTRAQQERHAFASKAEDAVRRALDALDLPRRQELRQLTRRVEELSRKIDSLRTPRPAAPRPAARKTAGRRR